MVLQYEIEERLNKLVLKEKRRVFSSWFWMNLAMIYLWGRPELRSQVFQFVDVLPRLKDREDIYIYWKRYLADKPFAPIPLKIAGFCGRFPALHAPIALAAETGVKAMARHFMVDEKPDEIRRILGNLSHWGASHSFDILGEQVISEREADEYMQKYVQFISFLRFEGRSIDLSIKFSSLYSQFDPLREKSSLREIQRRLGNIVNAAGDSCGMITVDMEQYYLRDLTWEIFKKAIALDEFHGGCAWGIAHQAYLRDSEEFLRKIIAFAKEREIVLTVRIVKGAYWDYEVATAKQKNWPVPVYEKIEETHASFERNVDIALAAYPLVKTAIGSHNLSSIAYAMARQQELNLPTEALEIQVLYGLSMPLILPVATLGYPIKVYVGVGNLLDGMAFLARRLLENTSQTSSAFFVPLEFARRRGKFRHRKQEGALARGESLDDIGNTNISSGTLTGFAPQRRSKR